MKPTFGGSGLTDEERSEAIRSNDRALTLEPHRDLKRKLKELLSQARDCELIAKLAGDKAKRLRLRAEKLEGDIAAERPSKARAQLENKPSSANPM